MPYLHTLRHQQQGQKLADRCSDVTQILINDSAEGLMAVSFTTILARIQPHKANDIALFFNHKLILSEL